MMSNCTDIVIEQTNDNYICNISLLIPMLGSENYYSLRCACNTVCLHYSL